MKKNQNSNDTAFSLVELVVVLAVLALLILVGISARASNPTSVRIACANNLRQVAVAFRLWESDNGNHFPQYYAGNFSYPIINSVNPTATPPTEGANWPPSGTVPYMYTVFMAMSNELNTPRLITCPSDTDRSPGAANFTTSMYSLMNSAASYFVGGDTGSELHPQMFLAGDRNMCADSTSENPVSTEGASTYSAFTPGPISGYAVGLTTNPPVNLGWNTIRMHLGVGNVALADGSVQLLNESNTRTALTLTGDTNSVSFQNYLLFP